eukprot:CAMPEP_0180550224 /NCGR_PEP_ID=MMETSP1036_2-20121128/72527_1 /TAXON_ID=632150 /ORGANISM="Azadinium spinosum, Strain 3D9" /LENGTH=45 /DNA_ID= /DNA_START= /DNA_END= /DNA_ORIENTATION=
MAIAKRAWLSVLGMISALAAHLKTWSASALPSIIDSADIVTSRLK